VAEDETAQQSQTQTPQTGDGQSEAAHAPDCDMGEDCSCGALDGEIVEEQPPEGTLAWLALQPTVEVDGLTLPACHRVDLSLHTIFHGEDDGRCRVTHKATGARCQAPRTRRYGLCMPHAGGGARDLKAIGARGGAALARLRLQRRTLGIGAKTAADPRQLARLRAHNRAEEIASALLAPLDDSDLSALSQQRSAVTILDTLWPVQQVTVTVDVPADEAGVQALGWAEMQALAAQLLGDTEETPALNSA